MSREKLRITKEWLQQLGIADVSKDGVVTDVKGKVKKISTNTKKHPFGKDKIYHVVAVYDKDLYKEKGYGGTRTLMLSRVMYAWYYGICPEDFDVDHIDNNSLNDTLDNLRLLSRGDNNRRHKPSNKILAKMPEEELEKYLDGMREFKKQIDELKEEIYFLKSQKLQTESRLKYIKSKLKDKELSYEEYDFSKALWESDYANIKENLKISRDKLTEVNKQAKEFKDTFLRKYKEN